MVSVIPDIVLKYPSVRFIIGGAGPKLEDLKRFHPKCVLRVRLSTRSVAAEAPTVANGARRDGHVDAQESVALLRAQVARRRAAVEAGAGERVDEVGAVGKPVDAPGDGARLWKRRVVDGPVGHLRAIPRGAYDARSSRKGFRAARNVRKTTHIKSR